MPKEKVGIDTFEIARREFIKMKVGALAILTSLTPRVALAALEEFLTPRRFLSFYNTHTGENLDVIYFVDGEYVSEALRDVNYILRDHRTEEIYPIDTSVLDLLYAISIKLRTRSPFHIICGYRSEVTNAMLRRRGRGVAKNSLHMQGKAADIRLPDRELASLRRVSIDLRAGGVGYYPRCDFVHVDVGRVRYW